MSFWRSVWFRLLVSHAVAGLLGVAAGAAYTRKMGPSTRAVYLGFARRPLLDAAHIASRFGSTEHSRATQQSLLRIPVAIGDLDYSPAPSDENMKDTP